MRVVRFDLAAALVLTLLALAALPAAAQAQDRLRIGAEVGTAIPHQLEVGDHTGRQQSFAGLKGENGLLVVFSRSVNW